MYEVDSYQVEEVMNVFVLIVLLPLICMRNIDI